MIDDTLRGPLPDAGRRDRQHAAGAAGAPARRENERRGNVILGKLEGQQPGGSVKDRPAISMIRRAEERGEIQPATR